MQNITETKICLYFHVHQPDRLKKYTYFDIGKEHDYEDNDSNSEIFQKVAKKCYIPTCSLLLKMIERYQGEFKVAFSLSGVFIEQCKKFSPETFHLFKQLAKTGCVEFLNETYFHSLSFMFSQEEFKEQILLHRELIANEFGCLAKTFRNTELIYNNDVAKFIEDLGYTTILAEGAEKFLEWRSAGFAYRPQGCEKIKVLLRNYQLTDDIGFRFSNRDWQEYPLLAEKYATWLHALYGQADIVNLFMDFETFGEHHWEDTGIFNFLEKLPECVLSHRGFKFVTPAEASEQLEVVSELDVPFYVSWADAERDLTAWYGNDLQKDSLHAIYELEQSVKALEDPEILHTWRALQISDHFYYMCTKYSTDGDVHKYFSPYHSPYDAYIIYQNVLTDFSMLIKQKHEERLQKPLDNIVNKQANKSRCCCNSDSEFLFPEQSQYNDYISKCDCGNKKWWQYILFWL